MAEVYLARDTRLGRKVALKLVQPHVLGSREAVDRFLFEARTTARFNHPHIVTVYEVGEHEERPYLALEHLEGQTLRQRMEHERPSQREILRIGLAVAEALQEAHRAKVLHRDLKPENVMLGRDGRLRVLDFGLAKVFLEPKVALADTITPSSDGLSLVAGGLVSDTEDPFRTQTGGIRGTYAYMAPEQWKDEEATGATDIWALGVIFYELAAGRRPYNEASVLQHCLKVCIPDPVSPVEQHASVPAELARLIGRCLQKDPAARPSADDVVEQLHAMLSDRTETEPSEDQSPFRGLLPFDERHRRFFFGRDSEVAMCIERLRDEPLLAVVGPTGAGKSSFVQAGVIPRLRENGPLDLLRVRPGSRPFRALAARIVAAQHQNPGTGSGIEGVFGVGAASGAAVAIQDGEEGSGGAERLAQQLLASPALLNLVLYRLAERKQCSVLLFVDQIEELYSLVEDPTVRQRFMEAVCAAADDPSMPVRVILTLREEFLSRLAVGPGVREALSRIVVLRSLGTEALTDAITQPVVAVRYAFDDPELPREMVTQVHHELAALPLLQFAGQLLWERRDRTRRTLCRSAYDEMGGVAGALAQHADGVLAGLRGDEIDLARAIFLRLVTAEGTRQVLTRSHLLGGLGPGAELVLARLVEARLLTVKQSEEGSEPELELVHESLVATWTRLRRWIDEGQEELAALAQIGQAAELWEKRGQLGDELWQGDALRDAIRAMERSSTEVPGHLARFLEAGRRRQLWRARRRRWVRAGAFLVVLAVALVLAAQNREARRQREAAELRRTESERQRAVALLEGARAALTRDDLLEARAKARGSLEVQDSAQARLLWGRLARHPQLWRRTLGGSLYAVDFSPDGQSVAAASGDGVTYLFDAKTRALIRILRGHRDYVFAVDFSPDGRRLATGSWDRTIRLWDVRRGSVERVLRGHTDRIYGVRFSPDGRLLASASKDGSVRLWQVASGAEQRQLRHDASVYAASFSPDGRLLASASKDRTVGLWQVATGSPTAVLRGHGDEVWGVSFSPDGRLLASASKDRTIRLWQVAAPAGPAKVVLKGHQAGVWAVSFRADGGQLASAGWDGTVRLWDPSSGKQLNVLRGHAGDVWGVSFSPRGQVLASVGYDKTLRLWRTDVGDRQPLHQGHTGEVFAARTSPDGRLLVSGGWDGTVRLWDRASGAQVGLFPGHAGDVRGLSFSPDGRLVASAGLDRTVRLWDLASGALERVIRGHTGTVWSVSFHPGGGLLASGSADHSVVVWDVATGLVRRTLNGHTGDVRSVAFSPGGRMLATAGVDRTLRLWAMPGGRELRVLRGHDDAVTSLSFSFDGHQLATGSNDRTVRLWDVATGRSQLLGRTGGRVNAVSFDRSGRRLGAATSEGRAWFWSLPPVGQPLVIQAHDGEVNGIDIDGLAVTAADDGTLRTWQLPSGRPRWRGPLMAADVPLLVSHQGEVALTGGRLRVDDRSWHGVVQQEARIAAIEHTSLCLVNHDDRLQLWDTESDRKLLDRPLECGSGAQDKHCARGGGPLLECGPSARDKHCARQILARPDGCVTLAGGRVRFDPSSGPRRELVAAGATAIAVDGKELLVAAGRRVLTLAADGRPGRVYPADVGVSAIARGEVWLALGYHDGNIELVPLGAGAKGPRLSFEHVPSSPVSRVLWGPRQTLVVGFDNGVLGVWDSRTGSRLDDARLHGPVVHLAYRAGMVLAATELGGHLSWDLRVLEQDRCALLREVWREVPLLWVGGLPVLGPPPAGHRCAGR